MIGNVVWNGEVLLANMLDLMGHSLEGKLIVELGSGTGLAAIVCAKLGQH